MGLARAAWLAGMAAGCFSPHVTPGAPCSAMGDCPAGLQCMGNVCVEPGGMGPDGMISCTCSVDQLTCGGQTTTCDLGCASDGARCSRVAPSNGVDPMIVSLVSSPITIDGDATFNTDTGEITGAVMRAAGGGVVADIAYSAQTSFGVFGFAALSVTANGKLTFVGTRAVVFVVGGAASVAGTIDGSAGCSMDASCAGPGGGVGHVATMTSGGCGPGTGGMSDGSNTTANDGGGGGGGAGDNGAKGGAAAAQVGGAGGTACIAAALEPLTGGSAGGGGGAGSSVSPARGGGGGGAFQLTALASIDVQGTIVMGGAGGEGGPAGAGGVNAGGGGGGGGGGGILLEAPQLTIGAMAILAANGGGGGGAGFRGTSGKAGKPGGADSTPAAGGAIGGGAGSPGGNGGAGTTPPKAAADVGAGENAGGGGGATGRIFLRAKTAPSPAGTTSPSAGTDAIRTE